MPLLYGTDNSECFGNLQKLAPIAAVCHRHGVLLLVDNAHGAYLKFLPQSRHPMDLGADLCCDSAHKTLPALTGGLLDRLRAYGALCPDWLRELLTAELSDWAAYGSTALAGLASRALALLGSMAAAVPALVLFAATTLLAVFFLAASYPTLCAAAKRRLSPRAQQRLRFWRDGVTHSLTRWLRAQAILCSLTFCQLLAGFWLLGERYSLLAAFLITLVDALPVFGTGTVLIPWALAELLLGSVPRGAALVILCLCTLTVRSITEPKLVAAQAGLPPIASLMAMYLGARAFGVAGIVLFPLLLLLAAQVLRTKKEGSM